MFINNVQFNFDSENSLLSLVIFAKAITGKNNRKKEFNYGSKKSCTCYDRNNLKESFGYQQLYNFTLLCIFQRRLIYSSKNLVVDKNLQFKYGSKKSYNCCDPRYFNELFSYRVYR